MIYRSEQAVASADVSQNVGALKVERVNELHRSGPGNEAPAEPAATARFRY
jgi:hypothetical protein